jgi:hypothetical protein
MMKRARRRTGAIVAAAWPFAACAQAGPAPAWLALLPAIVCAAVALIAVACGTWLLVLALRNPQAGSFSFRRHSGGFGGGSTGWQVSVPLARLACGLVLVVLAVALAMARLPVALPAHGDAHAGAGEAVPGSADKPAPTNAAAARAGAKPGPEAPRAEERALSPAASAPPSSAAAAGR